MQTKKCPKCNTVKPAEEFHKSKTKDGLARRCKVCAKKAIEDWRKRNPDYHKQHYQDNKEKVLEQAALWKERNKDRAKQANQEWYQENREEQLRHSKEWKENNKERAQQKNKEWYEKNKEGYLQRVAEYKVQNKTYLWEKEKEYRRERFKNDPAYRVTDALRSRLRSALASSKTNKAAHTIELLGCTPEFLVEHLTKQFREGMTWENYGPIWHIDHIRPCASFDLTNPEQQKQCFHYTNLQPLFAEENLKKRDKYEES